jgi:excisionase family DNA binding protein
VPLFFIKDNKSIAKDINSVYNEIKKGGNVMNDKPVYTVEEFAQIMGVKPLTVRRWIKNGEIQVIRLGRTVRISKDELKRKEK